MLKNIEWTLQVKQKKTHPDGSRPKPVHTYAHSQNIMELVPHTPSIEWSVENSGCQSAA